MESEFPLGVKVRLKRSGRTGTVSGSPEKGRSFPENEWRVPVRLDTGATRWVLASAIERTD